MQKIGWIGVGIMGKAMVRNLMKAGYEVHIYARHPERWQMSRRRGLCSTAPLGTA